MIGIRSGDRISVPLSVEDRCESSIVSKCVVCCGFALTLELAPKVSTRLFIRIQYFNIKVTRKLGMNDSNNLDGWEACLCEAIIVCHQQPNFFLIIYETTHFSCGHLCKNVVR